MTTQKDRDLFAADVLRYYLLREFPFGYDGAFSYEGIVHRYNGDLVNGYGNLVSRTLTMIRNYFAGIVPSPANDEGLAGTLRTVRESDGLFEERAFAQLLASCMNALGETNQFLSERRPWKEDRADAAATQRVADTLYKAAESIRLITAILYPVLPYACASVWRQLGLGSIEQAALRGDLRDLAWGGLLPFTPLGILGPVFPRADKSLVQKMIDLEAAR